MSNQDGFATYDHPRMDLSPQSHVVVTGAAGGIGRALAREFHAVGARVTMTDLDEPRLVAVCNDLNAQRAGSATAIAANIGSLEGNAAVISHARATFGAIDLFFANAGVGMGTDLENSSDDDWDTSFAVNVHAHRYAAEILLPDWLTRGRGYF